VDEGLLAQGGMAQEKWVGGGREKMRSVFEVVGLFGVGLVLVGVVVVCLRMGGM
jgi:hypothetical protein